MLLDKITPDIWLIHDFWDSEICETFISETDSIGYSADSFEVLRNNSVVKFETEILAGIIWEQIKDIGFPAIKGIEPVGINNRFRFYKYLPRQEFKRHKDCSYIKNEFESSYFSLLVYLYDEFEGGYTTFDHIALKPKKGTAVIFPHELMHSGSSIKSGIKYILRGDILCKSKLVETS